MENKLSNCVKINNRYHRSVNLLRDWEAGVTDEYILTSTGEQIINNFFIDSNQLRNQRRSNVFSLIGPFGTGKSAFALFLLDLFCTTMPKNKNAKAIRKQISFSKKSMLPVIVTGKKNDLKNSLLLALRNSIFPISESFSSKIDDQLQKSEIDDDVVIKFLEQANDLVNSLDYEGIFIVIDEFGKFLEFYSNNPNQGDIFFLQELAEFVERSKQRTYLITILHSSFEGYFHATSDLQKKEWNKIQGRFTDIPFIEPFEQFINLISNAIISTDEINRRYSDRIISIINSDSFIEINKRFHNLKNNIINSAPLHPLSTLLLYPIFRSKFSQNERSLFSFFLDNTLYGFQDFLNRIDITQPAPGFYQIDFLYDYAYKSLGTLLLSGDQSRKWAEIDNALQKLPKDSPEYAAPIIKVIGLLNLYGASIGLVPNKKTIKLAFENDPKIDEAIKYLEYKSVIIFRKYINGYSLWEGSDVNLEVEFTKAITNVNFANSITKLNNLISLTPFVAKAHYISSGTLRYFTTILIEDIDSLPDIGYSDISSDGIIVFVVKSDSFSSEQVKEFEKKLCDNSKKILIFAYPRKISGIKELLIEFETWHYILENVPSIKYDSIARSEIKSRLENVKNKVLQVVGSIFGVEGYTFNPNLSTWYYKEEEKTFTSSVDFQQWLSQVCDEIYSKCPKLINELINRENLSTAASSARRNLIGHIISDHNKKDLGMNQGTPPELSIYYSLLREGKFHIKENGFWKFSPPDSDWSAVWMEMESFLKSAQSNRKNLKYLIDRLKLPPFGIRDGVIVIILTVFILIKKDQLAIFEDGYFVPELLPQVFERISKQPNTFDIQYFPVNSTATSALDSINKVLKNVNLVKIDSKNSNVIDIVKPMIFFVSGLPTYTKKTKQLNSPDAMLLRNLLLRASDPYSLVYYDIPRAFGERELVSNNLSDIANILHSSIICLQQAYQSLLFDIQEQIKEVFYIEGDYDFIESEIRRRALIIKNYAYGSLHAFVREAMQDNKNLDWRECYGRAICNGKPTKEWLDIDKIKFRTNLLRIAGDFVRLEEMVLEREKIEEETILFRVGILGNRLIEKRQIVCADSNDIGEIEILSEKVMKLIDDFVENKNGKKNNIRLATIVKIAEQYLGDQNE